MRIGERSSSTQPIPKTLRPFIDLSKGIKRFAFSIAAAEKLYSSRNSAQIIEALNSLDSKEQKKLLDSLKIRILHTYGISYNDEKILGVLIIVGEENKAEIPFIYLGKDVIIQLDNPISPVKAPPIITPPKLSPDLSFFDLFLDKEDFELTLKELIEEADAASSNEREKRYSKAFSALNSAPEKYKPAPITLARIMARATMEIYAFAPDESTRASHQSLVDDLKERLFNS